eukprot:5518161-Amphidinium_carterae.3
MALISPLIAVIFKATGQFLVEYDAMERLLPDYAWSASWYRLDDSNKPVLDMSLHTVACLPFSIEPNPFWPLKRKVAQKRRGAQATTAHFAEPETQEPEADEAELDLPEPLHAQDGALPVPLLLRLEEAELEELVYSPKIQRKRKAKPAQTLQATSAPEDAGGDAFPVVMPSVTSPRMAAHQVPPSVALAASSVSSSSAAPPNANAAAATAATEAATIPPPPPPPTILPKAKAQRVQFLDRDIAAATVYYGSGKVSYYHSTGGFEARCMSHDKCTLSRTAKGRQNRGRVVAGRPVGLLGSWLLLGQECASKEEHRDKTRITAFCTHESRVLARATIAGAAQGPELMNQERPCEIDEAEEPVDLLGLL